MSNTDWKDETVQELKKGYMAMITDRDERIAILTAGSEAMQEDARNNTATIKAQAEEIRTLKEKSTKMKYALTETLVSLQAWQAIHPDDWDGGDKNAVAMAEKALTGEQ